MKKWKVENHLNKCSSHCLAPTRQTKWQEHPSSKSRRRDSSRENNHGISRLHVLEWKSTCSGKPRYTAFFISGSTYKEEGVQWIRSSPPAWRNKQVGETICCLLNIMIRWIVWQRTVLIDIVSKKGGNSRFFMNDRIQICSKWLHKNEFIFLFSYGILLAFRIE